MGRYRRVFVEALILAALLLHSMETTRASEPNWPQFRGPNCSGHACEGQNPPIQFGPEQNLLWKTPLPPGHSSPCIWGDNIFLTGFDKEKQELLVFCIDRNSGAIRWSRVVPAEEIVEVRPTSSPAAATPAADGERIYVYFGSYGLLCYDFDGNEQWKVPLQIVRAPDGHGTSPIVSGELVIFNRQVFNGPYLLAVDRHSGQVKWKQQYERRGLSHSTPVVWSQQLIIHQRGQIVGYDISDGKLIWSVSAATRAVSVPVIGKNIVYVGAWQYFGEADMRVDLPDFETLIEQNDKNGDRLISFEPNELPAYVAVSRRPEVGAADGATFPQSRRDFFEWTDRNEDTFIDANEWARMVAWSKMPLREHGLIAVRPGGKGDVTDTHVLWQEKTNVPEVPSPLYHDGRVYMIKNGGIASCMDAESGKLLYRERLGAPGAYYSSPICANGRIYIASSKGIMTVFETGDALKVLAKNDLKESIFATPAVVGNKLYVRTERHLYAFGE